MYSRRTWRMYSRRTWRMYGRRTWLFPSTCNQLTSRVEMCETLQVFKCASLTQHGSLSMALSLPKNYILSSLHHTFWGNKSFLCLKFAFCKHSKRDRSHGKPQQSQGCGCPSLVFDTVLLSMLSWSLGPQAWEQCLTPVLLNKSWPGTSVPLLWATLGCPQQVQRESRPGRSSRGLGRRGPTWSWAISISITWELVRPAEPQLSPPPAPTRGTETFIVTRSPDRSMLNSWFC